MSSRNPLGLVSFGDDELGWGACAIECEYCINDDNIMLEGDADAVNQHSGLMFLHSFESWDVSKEPITKYITLNETKRPNETIIAGFNAAAETTTKTGSDPSRNPNIERHLGRDGSRKYVSNFDDNIFNDIAQ